MSGQSPVINSKRVILFASIIEWSIAFGIIFLLHCLQGPTWQHLFILPFSLSKLIVLSFILAVGFQLFGMLLYYLIPSYKTAVHELMLPIFSEMRPLAIIYLAGMAGIAEELLFRGLLQPLFGISLSSIIFAFLHCGLKQELWAYGLFALLVSLILGYLFQKIGSLLIPITIHFFIDLLGGFILTKMAKINNRPKNGLL